MGKIEHVDLNGGSYPISFGMAALAEFLDKAGLQLSELDTLGQNLSLTNALQLVHIGLQHGGRITKEPYKAEFVDTCDLLDSDPEGLTNVLAVFADSLPEVDEKKAAAPAKKKRPSRLRSTP